MPSPPRVREGVLPLPNPDKVEVVAEIALHLLMVVAVVPPRVIALLVVIMPVKVVLTHLPSTMAIPMIAEVPLIVLEARASINLPISN